MAIEYNLQTSVEISVDNAGRLWYNSATKGAECYAAHYSHPRSERHFRHLSDVQRIQRPHLHHKNGYGDMVIMSMKAYEEKMWLLDAYAKLAEAEAELQDGKTVDARSALKEFRGKHGL